MQNIPSLSLSRVRELQVVSDADLIIKVGHALALHVSSSVMREASSTFAAMLKPEWRAPTLSSEKSDCLELTFPIDDERAMEILCHLLHYPTNKTQRPTDWDELVTLALLLEKYNCASPMETHLRRFVRKLKRSDQESGEDYATDESGGISLYYEALVYVVLKDEEKFSRATYTLISRCSGSFGFLARARGIDLLPSTFLRKSNIIFTIKSLQELIAISQWLWKSDVENSVSSGSGSCEELSSTPCTPSSSPPSAKKTPGMSSGHSICPTTDTKGS